MSGLVQRVKRLFDRDGDRDAAGEGGGARDDDREPAGLFQCEDCNTTYISKEMNACPECSQTVESVPTESDLGMA